MVSINFPNPHDFAEGDKAFMTSRKSKLFTYGPNSYAGQVVIIHRLFNDGSMFFRLEGEELTERPGMERGCIIDQLDPVGGPW